MKFVPWLKQIISNAPIFLNKSNLIPKITTGLLKGIVLKQDVLRYLELQVNTDCNQSCEMCFASKSRIPSRDPMTVNEIREVDVTNHKYRLIDLIMENKQNNRKSIIKIEQIQYNPNVNNEFFTTRYLTKE